MIDRLAALGVRLVCPACHEGLRAQAASLLCEGCGRAFPVIDGVPDLRLWPDRFLSMEDDRAKGLEALRRSGGRGFRAALEAYWALTPELSPALAKHHIRRQLGEVAVGRSILDAVDAAGLTGAPLLDLGCGAAALEAAAAAIDRPVIGVDAAFRWLLIGRERLREAGAEPLLLCANAEALPFEPRSFAAVCGNDLVEHVAQPETVAAEIARVLHPAGRAYIAANNRWSLLPEPHVRLPGVGWLPRRWQARYVRALRGHAYDKVRLLSGGELRSILKTAGLEPGPVRPAPLHADHLDGPAGLLARLLDALPWPAAVAPRIAVTARRPLDGVG